MPKGYSKNPEQANAKRAKSLRRCPLVRFMNKVKFTDSGCWEWLGHLNDDGYGTFKIGSRIDGTRRQVLAHRFAYELFIGAFPEGLESDHTCRNRACANPWHIEPVTDPVQCSPSRRVNGESLKTHCPKGHPYSGVNTYGYRICSVCQREAGRKSDARRRPKNPAGAVA